MTNSHLTRIAYLYVRQSTLRQVLTNTESAPRQYALRHRAIALGWPDGQIVTIDTDQGHSAASTVDREGFQRLVAEVGMGKAGIVLGPARVRSPKDKGLVSYCASLGGGVHAELLGDLGEGEHASCA